MCNHFLKNFVSLFSYSLLFLLGFFFYISLHHCSLSSFPSQSLCDLFFQVSISLSLFPLLFSSTLVFFPLFSFFSSFQPPQSRQMDALPELAL